MNKSIKLCTKIALVLTYMFTISGLYAGQSRFDTVVGKFFIKNDTGWDVKIKFAAPENTKADAQAVFIGAGKVFPMNKDDFYSISNLSVRRSGLGDQFSSWTALDVKGLRFVSGTYIEGASIPAGYKMDIYWNIQSAGAGWSAKATTNSRKAN